MKITQKKFKEALEGTGGNLTLVAKNLKTSRTAVYNFIHNNPELNELVLEEREKIVDKAETQLFTKLDNGVDWTIKYVLGTWGQKRGWVENPAVQLIEKQQNIQLTVNNIRELLTENEMIWTKKKQSPSV